MHLVSRLARAAPQRRGLFRTRFMACFPRRNRFRVPLKFAPWEIIEEGSNAPVAAIYAGGVLLSRFSRAISISCIGPCVPWSSKMVVAYIQGRRRQSSPTPAPAGDSRRASTKPAPLRKALELGAKTSRGNGPWPCPSRFHLQYRYRGKLFPARCTIKKNAL